jgi:drug/metabolite transporter (DMT)-like permease
MSFTTILAALLAVGLSGGSSVATKVGVGDLPPLIVASIRSALAGFAAVPLVAFLKLPMPNGKKQIQLVVLLTGCGFIAFPVFFSIGLQHTSAVHGALILAILPISTGALAAIWDKRWPSFLWWLGCAIAFGGEVGLILGRSVNAAGASIFGDVLVLISVLLGSVGNVAGGGLSHMQYSPHAAALWGTVLAGIVLMPFTLWVAANIEWHAVMPATWVSIIYLAVGVTIVGYSLWYWALGEGGIARVGVFQFLQPVSGVLLAYAIMNEPLYPGLGIAMAVILLGVWVAARGSERVRELS